MKTTFQKIYMDIWKRVEKKITDPIFESQEIWIGNKLAPQCAKKEAQRQVSDSIKMQIYGSLIDHPE